MDINELVDALNLLDEEVVLITLEGLGAEYDNFVTTITTNSSTMISFQVLQGLLEDWEWRLVVVNGNTTLLVNLVTNQDEKKKNLNFVKLSPKRGIVHLIAITG